LERARREPVQVARRIEQAGLAVSALSLSNGFTVAHDLAAEVDAAATFIRLAPLFETRVIKLTPGPPASRCATAAHWETLARAVSALVPIARRAGVKLAFETHMGQLTDTLAGARRVLTLGPPDVLGLTVDFSNLAFAGEDMSTVLTALMPRTFHTHLKNGCVDADGGWHFLALNDGLTDYRVVLSGLAAARYDGYLSIECLGEESRERPVEVARRDLGLLWQYLNELAIETPVAGRP
jgi:L-ribulose-5-phosphate 3-epimerase